MVFWVDPVSGNDGNTGLSFAQAKLTWKAGIDTATAAGAGHTVNMVNTGVITVPSAAIMTVSGITGTSYASPGLVVQGTDSSGNPALTEVRFQDNVTAQSLLDVTGTSAYILVQGFHVNWAANSTASTAKRVVRRNSANTNHIKVQGCYFHGKSTVGGQIYQDTALTWTTVGGEVCFNYFYDTNVSVIKVLVAARGTAEMHHNVIEVVTGGGTAQTIFDMGSDDAATTDHRFHHNTIVVRLSSNASIMLPVLSDDNVAAAGGIKHNHSNIYANYLTAGSDKYRYMDGPGGTPSSAGYSRTIGYNVFYLPGGLAYQSAANGPYWRPWDEDDVDGSGSEPDYWVTDSVSAVNNPFEDDSTSWDWDTGTGYTLTLTGDLRVSTDSGLRAAGKDGSVPGAIEDIIGVPTDPPTWDPGSGGLPLGPDAPGFLFPSPDGLTTSLRISRNTVLDVKQRVEGQLELITHCSVGHAVIATTTVAQSVNLLPDSRIYMLESDTRVTVQLNSQTFVLLAGGCMLVDGADLTTFRVTNPSTVREAILKYIGAR